MKEQGLVKIGEIESIHLYDRPRMISFSSIYESFKFTCKKDADEYELVDYYCKNRDCDCTSVRLEVMLNDEETGETVWYDYEKSGLDEPSKYAFLVEESKKLYDEFDTTLSLRHETMKLEFESFYLKNRERELEEEIEQLEYEKNLSQKTVRKDNKVGRNDPCPCGSGKKYKKCCLKS